MPPADSLIRHFGSIEPGHFSSKRTLAMLPHARGVDLDAKENQLDAKSKVPAVQRLTTAMPKMKKCGNGSSNSTMPPLKNSPVSRQIIWSESIVRIIFFPSTCQAKKACICRNGEFLQASARSVSETRNRFHGLLFEQERPSADGGSQTFVHSELQPWNTESTPTWNVRSIAVVHTLTASSRSWRSVALCGPPGCTREYMRAVVEPSSLVLAKRAGVRHNAAAFWLALHCFWLAGGRGLQRAGEAQCGVRRIFRVLALCFKEEASAGDPDIVFFTPRHATVCSVSLFFYASCADSMS